MSAEPVPNNELLDAARAKIAAGLAEYADGWSTTEGAIVTGFICLFEVMTPAGEPSLLEVCGGGAEGSDPMPVWRREGILHHTLYGDRKTH